MRISLRFFAGPAAAAALQLFTSSAFGQGYCGSFLFYQTFDGVTAPALPANWTASQGINSGDPLWKTSTVSPFTAPNDAFSTAPEHPLDNRLDSPPFLVRPEGPLMLFIRSRYDFENGFDGGVFEVSSPNINNGAFTDFTDPAVGGGFITGGYNGEISTAFQNPLAGRHAWTGNSNGYISSIAYLGGKLLNQTVVFRFRLGSDTSNSSDGWRIDNMAIQLVECNPPPEPTPPCWAQWSTGPNLPTPVAHAAGVYFPGNSRFYVMGGSSSDTAGTELTYPLEYDPPNARWTTKTAAFPDNEVNDMACEALNDSGTSYIYCIGGSANNATTATSRIVRYNPLTDEFSSIAAPWPGNTGQTTLPGGSAAVHNKLYILGGYQINTAVANKIWEFTPGSNTWTLKNTHLSVPLGFIPTTTVDDRIYTGGGSWFTPPNLLEDVANGFYYDPISDSGSAISNLPRMTGDARAVRVARQAWILGGGRTPPNPSSAVEFRDLNFLDFWLGGPPMAVARRSFPAASDGSTIWVAGGCGSDCSTPLRSMEIYQCICTGNVTFSENFDALPAGTPGNGWSISNLDPDTPPNDLFCPNPSFISNNIYDLPNVTIPTSTSVLRFRNNFNTEMNSGIFWDGGVLEVSSPNINGGAFTDITSPAVGCTFEQGGYTGTINAQGANPLAGRMAWSGNSHGYINTAIDLGPNIAWQTVTLRFRLGTDNVGSAAGWRVDTIQITDGYCSTPTPTPTPTATATATATGTPLPTPTATATPTSSPSPSGTPTPSTAKALNISTRLRVETGNDVGIGGFIITGPNDLQIVIRGIGPSLGPIGLTDFLFDPTLELRDISGNVLMANDNWQDDPIQAAQITDVGLAQVNRLNRLLSPRSRTAHTQQLWRERTRGQG